MTKCPICGATLGKDATKCPCGWKAEAGQTASVAVAEKEEIPVPKSLDEFQKSYLELASGTKAEVKTFNEKLASIEGKLDPLLDEKSEGSLAKIQGSIVELRGEIERVRINMPIYNQGALSVTERRSWPNSWRQEFFEFLLHGPFLNIKRQKGLARKQDLDEAKEYHEKMRPIWAEEMKVNPIFQGKYPEWAQKVYSAGEMGETVTGYGEEWIPPKFVAEIMMLATYESVIMREAGDRPLTVYKQQWPKGDYSNFTFQMPVAEGATPTQAASPHRLVTSVFELEAQRGVGMGLLNKRFLEDARIYGLAVVDLMVEAFKHAIAVAVDTQAFIGVLATPHLLDGLCVDANITDINLTDATLQFHTGASPISWEDWVSAPYELLQRYRKNGKFWVPPKGMAALPLLKNSNGDPIYSMPREGHPGTLAGYPVVEVDVMPETEATGEVAFLFGNMKAGFVKAFLEQARVDTTDQIHWAENQIDLKVELMMDMAISWDETWRRFLFYSST